MVSISYAEKMSPLGNASADQCGLPGNPVQLFHAWLRAEPVLLRRILFTGVTPAVIEQNETTAVK